MGLSGDSWIVSVSDNYGIEWAEVKPTMAWSCVGCGRAMYSLPPSMIIYCLNEGEKHLALIDGEWREFDA